MNDLKNTIADILYDLQFATGAYDSEDGYTSAEARECALEDIFAAFNNKERD